MLLTSGVTVFADRVDAVIDKPYLALGADLSPQEQMTVLSLLGLSDINVDDYDIISITNADEHEYLDKYLDASIIGTRALSSVLVVGKEAGNGIHVTTKNISYCTEGMYRNALLTAGIEDADSGEFNEICKHKVIDFMPGQSDEIDKGGTLRLGACPCEIRPGTTMERCYGTLEISERHRHRYEFNNDYRQALTDAGLTLSGLSPDGRLVETVELSDRPFFVGVQYHPEFKSRPNKAHPLFQGFIAASLEEAAKR